MFRIDAGGIPSPSEETTPPVTKTYFDIEDPPGGFSNGTGDGGLLNLRFGFLLQNHDFRLVLADRRFLHRELRRGLGGGEAHTPQATRHSFRRAIQLLN